jgi:GH18 family chitinase
VIGYYESWATTRACDKRQPEDIDLTAFTHLNFAFAFFDPKTFQMAPMSAGDQNLYRRFTGLKSKKPSLRTWIAVGGWSFNDPTNIPNTRTAFSDMVSSSANRKAFISSLSQFLQTYGFDGVDLDWEYPSADDRGGVKADKVNLNTFLKELKQAFGGRYGISITLPASYWYLQGFDVKTIQYYVDWMNVMSYDIHGVWDQGNVHTGPYVRPHTNITEIEEGLDLLWRAGVDSSKVVLGLGWYGRSFTLANPACSTPNGICIFSQGGNPGECTNSAGTLTNSEINRIISRAGVTKGFDKKAAVKWITWNTNQWVSYDDGETMQLKVAFANSRCLGGKMVWAVDQDDEQGSSSNDLLGIGPANGVSADVAQKIKDKLNDAAESAAVASSCYWTFCGERCTSGYFPATGANGQISGIQRDTECPKDSPQTLCCAPGTIMGACTWEGWRGVGLACAPVCKDTNATIVARNSNPEDRNCNGGYQAYCCSGFVPSSKTNTGGLALIGQGGLAKREEGSGEYGLVLGERGVKGGVNGLALGLPICAAIITLIEVIASLATAGLSLAGTPALYAVCMGIATVLGFIASGLSHMLQTFTNFFFPSDPGNIGTPVGNQLGQWQKLDFGGAQTGTTSCDCHVTYTCVYGRGYDEICDNQRWAIDQTLGGNTVYHSTRRQNNNQYSKYLWANGARHAGFRTAAQVIPAGGNMARCQVDEFPQGALAEGVWPNPQLVRLVNGPANNAQGVDYGQWLWAQFKPCSVYRKDVCHLATPAPPITWKFSNMGGGRKSTAGQNFIKAYGVSGYLSTFMNQLIGFVVRFSNSRLPLLG